MKLKRDFVELALRDGIGFRQLCRNFGISPPTGYKWLSRYREMGVEGLAEQSRARHHQPLRTPERIEQLILDARGRHPAWGARKLRRWLRNKGHGDLPQPSTITGILRRHGLLGPPPRPEGPRWKRFERSSPNELWQMDFKGPVELARGGRCHPLTLLDDHSRFNLLLDACGGESGMVVQPRLEKVFRTYGLPDAILCDNGRPWGDSRGFFTTFEAWLLRVGVEVRHGRPCHPQTQGKEERFHRTLNQELLSRTTAWRDLAHCQERFAEWREGYNHERPHDALGGDVPASRHRASPRELAEKLREAESWYEPGEEVRMVKSKGEMTFRNVFWTVGRAFAGQKVVMRPAGERRWEVVYCWKRIGVLDLEAMEGKSKGWYEPLRERFDGGGEEAEV
ncbi:MAG: IS481 family transposase [Akkermansiaceae bacterium]|nr:IS481 family transposase [Akkermansiaceae bacterium]